MITRPTVTTRWQTMGVVGYEGGVGRYQNPAAHGGVCLLQARRAAGGRLLGRRVNSTGRQHEYGEAFPIDAATLARWREIGA